MNSMESTEENTENTKFEIIEINTDQFFFLKKIIGSNFCRCNNLGEYQRELSEFTFLWMLQGGPERAIIDRLMRFHSKNEGKFFEIF